LIQLGIYKKRCFGHLGEILVVVVVVKLAKFIYCNGRLDMVNIEYGEEENYSGEDARVCQRYGGSVFSNETGEFGYRIT